MKLAIGCDEAAYRLKVIIMEHLKEKHAEIEVTDFGVAQGNTVLYPNVAYTVADAVASGGSSGASCCAALASVCAFAPTRSRGSVRQCATTPIQRNEAARAITRRSCAWESESLAPSWRRPWWILGSPASSPVAAVPPR